MCEGDHTLPLSTLYKNMSHVKCLACYVIIGVNEIFIHQNGKRHQRAAKNWNYTHPIFIPSAKSFAPKKWRYKHQLEDDYLIDEDFFIDKNHTTNNIKEERDLSTNDDEQDILDLEHSIKRTRIKELPPTEHFNTLEGCSLFELLETKYLSERCVNDEMSEIIDHVHQLSVIK